MTEGREIEAAMRHAEDQAKGETAVALDARALRNALGKFATGVTVVTAREIDTHLPIGITANSFASVSLDPPLVLWSAARSSVRHAHFSGATAFAVHVLAQDQRDLAARFSRNGAGFNGLTFEHNAEEVPVLPGVLARFECQTEVTHEGGDHTIIIGRVLRFSSDEDAAPLVFSQGAFGSFDPAP